MVAGGRLSTACCKNSVDIDGMLDGNMGMAFVALSVNVNNGGHRIVVRFGSVDWTQGRQTPGLDRFPGFA